MVIGFMQKFPNGKPTNFEQKIMAGEKIHTIRKGERWRAGMLMHMNVCVRTKFQRKFLEQKVISTQEVFITFINGKLEITVDDKYLYHNEIETLLQNDGVTRDEFINWLLFNDLEDGFSGQIIHWTDLKY